MDRIKKLCTYLNKCNLFADVACDHGYIAEYMLKNKLCESAIVSDISEKSLNKAKTLLKSYIEAGKCRAVCCDGLKGIDENVDCVMIAGIGGEEIIKILKEGFIPRSFVFQPMKNAPLLRRFLLDSGCALQTDDIFTDGKKYYFLIAGKRGKGEKYSENQLLYGKDSLKNPLIYDYIRAEKQKTESYLKRAKSEESKKYLEDKLKNYTEVLKGEDR